MLNKIKSIFSKNIKNGRTLKKILIVDDESSIRELLATYLDDIEDNIQVFKASNYDEAMEILKKDNSFRLVVTDIVMPGKSGLTLLSRMRKTPGTSKIPVLVISGNIPQRVLSGLKEEFSRVEVLQKPFKMKEFQNAVNIGIEKGFRTVAV